MSYFKPKCLPLISVIQEPFSEESMREMEGHEREKGLETNKTVCVCIWWGGYLHTINTQMAKKIYVHSIPYILLLCVQNNIELSYLFKLQIDITSII